MMDEKFIKVGNVRFNNDGTVVVELPKPQNIEDIQIFAERGTKEWELARQCLKKRMEHCALHLSQNIGSACAENGMVFWVGGHFSIRAYQAMQRALLRKDWTELKATEVMHTMKAVYYYGHLFGDSSLADSAFEFACAYMCRADSE